MAQACLVTLPVVFYLRIEVCAISACSRSDWLLASALQLGLGAASGTVPTSASLGTSSINLMV